MKLRVTKEPSRCYKGDAFGINPELLINMQSRYNMSVARQKKPLLAKLTDIRRACAAVF